MKTVFLLCILQIGSSGIEFGSLPDMIFDSIEDCETARIGIPEFRDQKTFCVKSNFFAKKISEKKEKNATVLTN
ncbi:MAG: hypothetical protein SFU98_21680 [Leptospiraceae bacterium]|nr:hypothetical protein [Leptospiraceae bacterium]